MCKCSKITKDTTFKTLIILNKCKKEAKYMMQGNIPYCEHHFNKWIKKMNKKGTIIDKEKFKIK